MTVPTFVISLKHDKLRRTHMHAELKKSGMVAEFFDAVDGKKLTPKDRAMVDKKKTLRVYGKNFLDSEIGCYLSHYRLWELMVRDKIPYAVIMEDDITISNKLPSIIDDLIAQKNHQWRVVRLESLRTIVREGKTTAMRGRVVQKLRHGNLHQPKTHILGFGAYLISLDGAKKMLSYGKKIFMPVDQTMDRYWENGILPYIVRPIPVAQKTDFESRIGARPHNQGRKGLTLMEKIMRRFVRIKDSLQKRLFWILR